MARVSVEEYVEKHRRRVQGATQDYQTGVMNVRQAPGIAAAAKSQKMLQGVQESVTSGRWGKSVAAVSLTEWQTKAATKGASRLSEGVVAAEDRIRAAASKLLPAVDAAAAKVKTMPDMTLQDRINRSVTFMTEMAKTRGR